MGFDRNPEDFDHREAELDSLRMHYVREGQGEPLILMHGWPTFWWVWHENIPVLAEEFTVIAPDWRGFGDTENPDVSDPSNYHLDHSVKDLLDLIDHLGFERVHMIAHDYGSMILHKFVRRHPERVNKILLFSGVMPGFEEDFFSPEFLVPARHALINQMPEAAEIIGASRKGVRLYIGQMYRHFCGANNPFEDDEEMEIFVDAFTRGTNLEAGFHWYKNLGEAWGPVDRTVYGGRAHFLWGLRDPVLGPQADLISNWYNNFTFEPAPEAGHFLQLEDPELLNRQALEFFAGAD